MKVLLANPPWRDGRRHGLRSGARFPYLTDELTAQGVPAWIPFPFTLAQTATLLEQHGFTVELWDAVAEGTDPEAFLRRVTSFAPDLYLQEIVAPSYSNDRALLALIKAALPRTVCGAAGLMVTGWGPALLTENPSIDVGLTYEWEETALELATRLRDGRGLAGTLGLFHRQDGAVVAEPRRPAPDLARLPWPAHERLPMLNYNDDFAFLPVPNLQMFTSRGCPYKCTFCVWINARYGGPGVRFRDPEDVVAEIEHCTRRWPFRAVYFDDDTFNLRKSYVLSLCESLRRRGMQLPWAAMCRADLFDRETLRACREAGLYAVKYGIESADPGILAGVKKDLDLARAEEVIALTREAGVLVHLTLVIGLPGETRSTLQATWRFVKRVKPDFLQFSLATPYPGTELYEQAAAAGWIEACDWSEFNADSQAAMRTAALSREELEQWVRKLNLRRFALQFLRHPLRCLAFYSRKAWSSPRKLLNVARSALVG